MNMNQRSEPEKSTHQLAVWLDLVNALDEVDAAWRRTQAGQPGSTSSCKLPANVASALAKAVGKGVTAVTAAADVLANQLDTGDNYVAASSLLRQALCEWPID